MYEGRFYRRFELTDTVAFAVSLAESDLFIRADRDLSEPARFALSDVRAQLERYIRDNPYFSRSLAPVPTDPTAPAVVRAMIAGGQRAGVGPMAAVAGAISEAVGSRLARESSQVIVENGGDLFLTLKGDLAVGLYAGRSPLSGKVGFLIHAGHTPCGLCTSSGTVGHSLSHGSADAVTVLARDAALADAAATAVGNRVSKAGDVGPAVDFAMGIEGVLGVCVVRKDKLGICGDLELQPIDNEVTK